MLINPEIKDEINPLVSGGTGSHSDMADMPSELPDRFESGTLNLPGIFGLHAALRWLEENFEKVHEHEKALSARMLDGLKDVEGIYLAGQIDPQWQVFQADATRLPVAYIFVVRSSPRNRAGHRTRTARRRRS